MILYFSFEIGTPNSKVARVPKLTLEAPQLYMIDNGAFQINHKQIAVNIVCNKCCVWKVVGVHLE